MKINIYLNDDRSVKCDTSIIGKTYENEATILHFILTEEMIDKDIYLEFEKTDGTKFVTPRLEGKVLYEDIDKTKFLSAFVDYNIPNSILDIKGDLKCEVVLRKDNQVWKSYTLKFNVLNSINASEELPKQYPDFVSEAQKVIDLVETTGEGTQYLANDGTYKEISGNKSGVTYLESDTSKLIYLRDLETGIYVLNGSFRSYNGSTTPLNFINALATLNKTTAKTYIQVIYPVSNRIQYMEITDENHTITQIMLSAMLSRIEALEKKAG